MKHHRKALYRYRIHKLKSNRSRIKSANQDPIWINLYFSKVNFQNFKQNVSSKFSLKTTEGPRANFWYILKTIHPSKILTIIIINTWSVAKKLSTLGWKMFSIKSGFILELKVEANFQCLRWELKRKVLWVKESRQKCPKEPNCQGWTASIINYLN